MYKVHYKVSQCGGILNYFYEVYLIHHAQVHIMGYRVVHTIIQVIRISGFFHQQASKSVRRHNVVKYC